MKQTAPHDLFTLHRNVIQRRIFGLLGDVATFRLRKKWPACLEISACAVPRGSQ